MSATKEELIDFLKEADARGDKETAVQIMDKIDSLEESAQVQNLDSVIEQKTQEIKRDPWTVGNVLEAAREVPATLAVGAVSSVLGGLSGLGNLLMGKSSEEAAANVEFFNQAPRYVQSFLRNQAGESNTALSDDIYGFLGFAMAPIEWAGESVGQSAAQTARMLGASPEVQGFLYGTGKASAETLPFVKGMKPISSVVPVVKKAIDAVKIINPKTGAKQIFDATEKKWMDDVLTNNQTMDNLKTSASLQKEFGLEYDIATATQVPQIFSTRNALLGKSSQLASETSKMQERNLERITQYAEKNGVNIDTSKKFMEILDNSNKTYIGVIDGLNAELLKNRNVFLNTMNNHLSNPSYKTADKLQNLMFDQYQLNKVKGGALYDALGNPEIPVQVLSSNAGKTTSGKNLWNADEYPTIIRNIEQRLQSTNTDYRVSNQTQVIPPKIPLNELKDLNSDLGAQISVERFNLKNSSDPAKQRMRVSHLSELKASLERDLDVAETIPGVISDVKLYREANKFWRENVQGLYRDGIAGDYLKTRGPEKVKDFYAPSENAVNKFLQKDGKLTDNDMTSLIGSIKSSENAYVPFRELVGKEYIDIAFKKDKEGNYVFNKGASEKFFNEHQRALDKVPEIKDELNKMSLNYDLIDNNIRAINQQMKSVEDRNIFKIVAQTGTDNLLNSMRTIEGANVLLSKAKEFNVSRNSLSDLVSGLVYQRATKTRGNAVIGIDSKSLNEAISENPGWKEILGKDRVTRLNKILDASYRSEQSLTGLSKVEFNDMFKDEFGLTKSKVSIDIRSIGRGKTSRDYLYFDGLINKLNDMEQRHLDKLVRKSFTDVDIEVFMARIADERAKRGKISKETLKGLAKTMRDKGYVNEIFKDVSPAGVAVVGMTQYESIENQAYEPQDMYQFQQETQ